MASENDQIRAALSEAFREFFRVVSVVYLTNPPKFDKLEEDRRFQEAVDRLASAIARKE